LFDKVANPDPEPQTVVVEAAKPDFESEEVPF
jgi:hypothetical protein